MISTDSSVDVGEVTSIVHIVQDCTDPAILEDVLVLIGEISMKFSASQNNSIYVSKKITEIIQSDLTNSTFCQIYMKFRVNFDENWLEIRNATVKTHQKFDLSFGRLRRDPTFPQFIVQTEWIGKNRNTEGHRQIHGAGGCCRWPRKLGEISIDGWQLPAKSKLKALSEYLCVLLGAFNLTQGQFHRNFRDFSSNFLRKFWPFQERTKR